MYIARILYPVRVLGPGERIGIWFAGCKHECKGCCNPELWGFNKEYYTSIDVVMHLINKIVKDYSVDGFTISGGDPFEQPEALCVLLDNLNSITNDIMVYTGYSYSDIRNKYPDILEKISVLIDGKYIESQNNGNCLKGSDNQNIIFINESFEEKYKDYIENSDNSIQNFNSKDGIISVGIHKPGFKEELTRRVRDKGLEEII